MSVLVALSGTGDLLAQVTISERKSSLSVGTQVPVGELEAVGQLTGNAPVKGCTATLTGKRTVLTAAHCVCPTDASLAGCATRAGIILHDVFGVDDKATSIDEAKTRRSVTLMGTVRVHPEYGLRGWLREDFAVIDLDHSVDDVAPSVQPVSIEKPQLNPLEGDTLTLVGYGQTGVDCTGPSMGKRAVDLEVTEANFAAIYFASSKGVCPGDSGGPVLNRAGHQVGVASHGRGNSTYRPTSFAWNWIFNRSRSHWSDCQWVAVGNSHGRGGAWCPSGSYLVQLDLDGNRQLDAHDAPVVGRANCCALAGATRRWGSCSWVEVERRGFNSHGKRPDWCPDGTYLAAIDQDGDRVYGANDTPVIGGAYCCGPADSSARHWGSTYWIDVEHVGLLAPRKLNSHSAAAPAWCLDGAFMTQIDLDGNPSLSDHDAPVVGGVKCSRPTW